VQHLHEQGGVGRVALHVLEVEEVLAPLGHGAQLGQQSHQLVVLLGNIGVAVVTVLHQYLVDLLTRLLNMGSVVQIPNFR